MIGNPAVSEFLNFVRAYTIGLRLVTLLGYMNVPQFRRDVTKHHNLMWLNRNIEINSLYPEVKRLIRLLLSDGTYMQLTRMFE